MVSREDYGLRRLHGHRRSGDCGHPSGQGAQPGEPPASCPVSAGCQASGIRRRLAGDGDGPASVQDSQGVAREFGAASFVHSLDRACACMCGRSALAFRQKDPVPAAPGAPRAGGGAGRSICLRLDDQRSVCDVLAQALCRRRHTVFARRGHTHQPGHTHAGHRPLYCKGRRVRTCTQQGGIQDCCRPAGRLCGRYFHVHLLRVEEHNHQFRPLPRAVQAPGD